MEECHLKSKTISCRKCCSENVKVIFFENEGKKFAVCEACGNVQGIGGDLRERYRKWLQDREQAGKRL